MFLTHELISIIMHQKVTSFQQMKVNKNIFSSGNEF